MPVDLTSLLAPEGAIARRLEAFETRPQQEEMAAAVERTLETGGRLIVEAGTGVGKSFAYLLPAIKRIVEHGERVLVVTNTINLQEQLIEKDIPLLNAVIPEEFTAVLVKGRGNYVSLRRLKLASARQERLFPTDAARRSLHLIEDWVYTTRDGSLATLPQLPRPEVWDVARSDTHNCMGRKCPLHQKCFYQAARRRMENGDLLVCNHALFFADLALRGQGVSFLPTYDHVILDEAHRVEDVAAEHFGISLAESRVEHLLNLLYQPRTRRGFLGTLKLADGSTERIDQTIEQTPRCRNAVRDLFDGLLAWQEERGPANGRMRQPGIVPNSVSAPLEDLADLLDVLRERAASEADKFELNSYVQRAADMAQHAAVLLEQRLDGCVYWLEGAAPRGDASGRPAGRRRRPRVVLRCVPVEVGPILEQCLLSKEISVVLTSATLATGPGDFSHITGRLGCAGAETLQLGSPFDHATQMRAFVDRAMPEPAHPEYVDRLWPRIEQLVRATDGGAFVLFTSFAMLDRVAEHLRPALAEDGYPVLAQGADGPPGLLLKRFRDDRRSVLLGTISFWQGVDVRGEGLRNVIITRLPFEVPDLPLVEARREMIQARGGNAFMEEQLPKAVIRFKQGIGRLIRSHGDTGRVAVLDPRVLSKPYGRKFLDALPEGVIIEDVADESGDWTR